MYVYVRAVNTDVYDRVEYSTIGTAYILREPVVKLSRARIVIISIGSFNEMKRMAARDAVVGTRVGFIARAD